MDPVAVRLLARIGAIEFLVENIYAVALMQTCDPAGAARRWAAQAAALSRRAGVDVDGVDRALAAALVAGMANEIDAIFGQIIERLDTHARDHPTAGRV